jgi:ethanolamine ammonia-lyase small subunit
MTRNSLKPIASKRRKPRATPTKRRGASSPASSARRKTRSKAAADSVRSIAASASVPSLDKLPVDKLLVENPWPQLRRFTSARIALGRTGQSLPTRAVLDFGLAHAQARDAVHVPLDAQALEAVTRAAGQEVVRVHSAALDRVAYLRRPDLGRSLDDTSRERVSALARTAAQPADIVFVIADGLSAQAAMAHAVPVLRAVLPKLEGWAIAPVFIAEQARVALGDEIGQLLGTALAVMLIGERPGLSSPDSLGLYVTYQPRIGRTDSERNCISNVRPKGLGYTETAHKLAYLLKAARRLGYSGVRLKDESGTLVERTTIPPDKIGE